MSKRCEICNNLIGKEKYILHTYTAFFTCEKCYYDVINCQIKEKENAQLEITNKIKSNEVKSNDFITSTTYFTIGFLIFIIILILWYYDFIIITRV